MEESLKNKRVAEQAISPAPAPTPEPSTTPAQPIISPELSIPKEVGLSGKNPANKKEGLEKVSDDIEKAERVKALLAQVGSPEMRESRNRYDALEVEIKKAESKERAERVKKLLELQADRANRPFLYYLAAKNENPYIEQALGGANANFVYAKDWNSWSGEDANFMGKYNRIQYIPGTNNQMGYFEYTACGFIMVIKNVEQLEDKKGNIHYKSDEAIYQIIGPDGYKVTDNIIGYNPAHQKFQELNREYIEMMRQEFAQQTGSQ